MEQGLTSAQASSLLQKFGPNSLATESKTSAVRLFLAQLRSPLLLILVAAATVSLFVREWVDAGIVLIVIFGSAVLSFLQEYSATRAMEKLRQRVQAKATVLRDGKPIAIPLEGVVPGDVVLLSAGSLIPADATVLEARDCFVNQAVLTGETYPAEKRPGAIPATASLAERTNTVFLGTSVRSGTARALVTETGPRTAFGQIAGKLTLRPPETGFEQGIRKFGYLLTKVMIVLVFFGLRDQRFWRQATHREPAVRHRACRGPGARTAAGDPEHHALPRRAAHGRAGRDCPPPERHRELRQYGHSLHR